MDGRPLGQIHHKSKLIGNGTINNNSNNINGTPIYPYAAPSSLPPNQPYLCEERPSVKTPHSLTNMADHAPAKPDLNWRNGYQHPGRPFETIPIQHRSNQTAVLQDFSHHNSIPPRTIPMAHQFHGLTSADNIMPNMYVLPAPMASSNDIYSNSSYNLNSQNIIPRQTQFRQLPSMTTVICSNSSKKLATPYQPQQHSQNALNNINIPLNVSLANYTRRSLPPVAHLVQESDPQRRSLNNGTATGIGSNYPSRARQSQPLKPVHDNSTNRQNESPLRKLPIITPNGPQPIYRPPLRSSQAKTGNQILPPTKGAQIVNDPRLLRSTNDYDIKPEIETYASNLRHNSENSNPSESHPLPWSQRNVIAPKKRSRSEVAPDRPPRQLPIITKQGVLKLRDKAPVMVNSETERMRQSKLTGTSSKRHGWTDNRKTETEVVASKHQHRKILDEEFSSDHELTEDQSPVQYDMDIDEDHDVGEDFYESEIDNEELASSGSALGPDQSLDMEEGSEDYSDTKEGQHLGSLMDNSEQQDEEELEEEDETEKDENFYVDSTRPNDLEEEAEFFSALATVPEEEGKLSDKDVMHEYNRVSDSESNKSEAVKSNDKETKPSNIVDNGFEAQVLEYIAEKTGLRRGELFSVDEEPSSYNDESRASEVDSQADQAQMSGADGGAGLDRGFAKNQLSQLSTISNDETFQLKGDNSLQDDYAEQQSHLNESSEQTIRDSMHNDSMLYDEPNMDFIRDDGSRVQKYTQNSSINDQTTSVESGVNEQYDFKENLVNNLQNTEASGVANIMSYTDGGEQLEVSQNYAQDTNISHGMPEMKISAEFGDQIIESSDVNRFYELDRLQGNNYQSNEREGDEEEEDGRGILISTSNNKSSLEQEEYDEQYRDINNLDDLDRRATNHVHAIDGHSKSMLNDIHQQRTIVDYYDEDGDFENYGQSGNDLKEEIIDYDDNSKQPEQDSGALAQQHYYSDEEKDKIARSEEGNDDKNDEYRQPGDDNSTNEYNSNLPRARWIAAVNKIVNHIGEVSKSVYF